MNITNYEVYLTDDSGQRIALLNNLAFISLARSIVGYGTLHIGIPLDDFKIRPIFLVDRRVEVWRAPRHGATMREEGTFFLRKWNVYTRDTDNVNIVEFYGRSPIDILRRESVTSNVPANHTKQGNVDDMMKAIVTENFITPPRTVPVGELVVEGDESLGVIFSHSFYGQNVLDVLKDLRDISIARNVFDPASIRVYFDVVRGSPLPNGGFGFYFRTYAHLRGSDRRPGPTFSVENGNIKSPSYFEDHLDSITLASVLSNASESLNGSAESPDRYLSRWNDILSAQQSSEANQEINDARANQMVQEGRAEKALNVTFLNSPGSSQQPRSLYGVDWDLGDLIPVTYAGMNFLVEVTVVNLAVNDNGEENIVGMTRQRVLPEPETPYDAEYLVVAGGGGGGSGVGGGGGGGEVKQGTKTLVQGNLYSVTVGAGGAGAVLNSAARGSAGNNSVFDDITSLGGGGGGGIVTDGGAGGSGGSGGGGGRTGSGGSATGSGSNGGAGFSDLSAGGGGGQTVVGSQGDSSVAGAGGAGISSSASGSPVTYGGGGGGGGSNIGASGGTGGAGGGGDGSKSGTGVAATANTGGGGGGGGQVSGSSNAAGGAGGSGVVIVRVRTAIYTGVYTGSPSISVDGIFTVLRFTGNGSYTA